MQKGPLCGVGSGFVPVANRRAPRASRSALTSDGAARAGGALYGALIVKLLRSCGKPLFVLGRVSAQSADAMPSHTQTGSADGSRPTAAKRARVSASLDAEHF